MAIKTFKPYTPARRNMTVSGFDGVDKKAKPERSLVETLKKHAGRNSYGHITVRHHGGGNKRKYRVIDFQRLKTEMPATVQRIEYDPNRSAYIALVRYEDNTLSYILAPYGLKAGDVVLASANADIKPGNCLPIANIPVGTVIHNVELQPGHGAQLVRSAGAAAQRPYQLHRLHRSGGQPGSRERAHRQGRSEASHGRPSHRPRFRHEPQRPSSRWW